MSAQELCNTEFKITSKNASDSSNNGDISLFKQKKSISCPNRRPKKKNNTSPSDDALFHLSKSSIPSRNNS